VGKLVERWRSTNGLYKSDGEWYEPWWFITGGDVFFDMPTEVDWAELLGAGVVLRFVVIAVTCSSEALLQRFGLFECMCLRDVTEFDKRLADGLKGRLTPARRESLKNSIS
jgi:hypothetical protein